MEPGNLHRSTVEYYNLRQVHIGDYWWWIRYELL